MDSAKLLGAPVYLVTRPLASLFSRGAHCSHRWRWTLQWRAAASYSVTLLVEPNAFNPLFLGHFSPVLRRLFTVLLRFPASWRQDGENGRRMA